MPGHRPGMDCRSRSRTEGRSGMIRINGGSLRAPLAAIGAMVRASRRMMRRSTGRPSHSLGSTLGLESLEGRKLLSAAGSRAGLATAAHFESLVLSKHVSQITGQVKGFSAPDALNTSTPYFYRGFTG